MHLLRRHRGTGTPARPATETPTAGRTRRRYGRRSERGVTLVEAAMVTPLFLLTLFGVFEYGLTLRDYIALSSGVRAAARTGSTSGSDPSSDYQILQAFKNGTRAIGANSAAIQSIVIYKATGPTNTLSSGDACVTSGVSGRCNRYTAADLSRASSQFGCITANVLDSFWCPTTRKTRLSDPPDYIGVYVTITHNNPTGLFGKTKTLTDQIILRLEPQRL